MPFKYSKQQKRALLAKFVEYVNSKDNPMIAEFCYQNNIDDQTLIRWGNSETMTVKDENANIYDFALTFKKSKLKQQVFLNALAIKKGQNPGGPIFLLKALHGYKDGSEQQAAQTNLNVNIDKVLNAEPEKLESGVQSLLQSTKIDNSRKRKSPSQKN